MTNELHLIINFSKDMRQDVFNGKCPHHVIRELTKLLQIEDSMFYFTLGGIPRQTSEGCDVYICMEDIIHAKCKAGAFLPGSAETFFRENGKDVHFNPKAWLILSGPVIPAPEYIYFKSFRGIRYTQSLF